MKLINWIKFLLVLFCKTVLPRVGYKFWASPDIPKVFHSPPPPQSDRTIDLNITKVHFPFTKTSHHYIARLRYECHYHRRAAAPTDCPNPLALKFLVFRSIGFSGLQPSIRGRNCLGVVLVYFNHWVQNRGTH